MKCIFSQDIVLTDEHISMLERCASKFRAGNTNRREKIVEEAADTIKGMWKEDTEFDRDGIINVCGLSAKLSHSQRFIAHSPTSVR